MLTDECRVVTSMLEDYLKRCRHQHGGGSFFHKPPVFLHRAGDLPGSATIKVRFVDRVFVRVADIFVFIEIDFLVAD
jgi:hypothetical protein